MCRDHSVASDPKGKLFRRARLAASGAGEPYCLAALYRASDFGRFRACAYGGTLFLDEIGTLSLSAQGKLLRALQEGEIERVGDQRNRKVNVRLVAATNVNPGECVAAGPFREDLYSRSRFMAPAVPPGWP